MAMLKLPNAFLELSQNSQSEPADHRQRPCDFGYPHFALQVDNAHYGQLDTLVNAAGIVDNIAPLADRARASWDHELAVTPRSNSNVVAR